MRILATAMTLTAPMAVTALFVALCGCSRAPDQSASSSASGAGDTEAVTPALPAPEPEPSPLELILELDDAQAAFAAAAPLIDDQIDQLAAGTILFALWAAERLEWSDVFVSRDETSIKLTKKDPISARGKRMCWSGRIMQIQRDRSVEAPLFTGTMATRHADFIHYLAVGSSGDLVEGSRARLCGFVTGIHAYANVSGGQTQAVQMVGMFQIPDNTGMR